MAALIVSASVLAAMLVARYVDLGAIGPFPDVYDRCGSQQESSLRSARAWLALPLLPVSRCIGGLSGKPDSAKET
jgi:hypothetical protein